MLSYVLRRLLWMVPTMIGITVLLFCVMQLAPGDPAALKTQGEAGGMGSGSSATADVESAYEKFRKRYKLDEPLGVQYVNWVEHLVTLDFGTEFFRPNVQVADELWRRLQVTVPLSIVSVLLSYLIALPLGMLSAVKRGSLIDKITTFGLFVLYSLPTFWAGLMLIILFGQSSLGWLPVVGLHDQDADQFGTWQYAWDTILHGILPVTVLTYAGLAYLSRQMRTGMLEVVRQDYIRTARAKGLSEKVVVFKHAMRNSLIPVVTIFAQILPILIGGSVIVEKVFNVQGMGLYAYEALLKRDYPVIMATVTVTSFMTLLGFLISDILYAVVDPRIKYD
ncbi:MAG: ABC transporter permease [Planctomycetes bacterium]|nr:ABC transporter permease [Planctomycetota bacterium]